MLPSRVLTALASPTFSLADLRSQAPMIIVGFILLAVGMAAVTLFFFSSARAAILGRSISVFSQSSMLYGFSYVCGSSVLSPLFPDLSWITSIYGLPSPF